MCLSFLVQGTAHGINSCSAVNDTSQNHTDKCFGALPDRTRLKEVVKAVYFKAFWQTDIDTIG